MTMFSNPWFLARKEVKYWMRDREVWLWTFFMPLLFIFFIGSVTRGGGGSSRGDGKSTIAVEIPANAGFLAEQIERRLEDNNFAIVHPAADELAGHARRLAIPDRFTDRVVAGEPLSIQFRRQSGGLGNDFDRLRVGRAVYTVLADVIAAGKGEDRLTADQLEVLNQTPRALTVRIESAGKRETIPTGFEQAIPGTLVVFVLMNVLTSGAITLVVDRRRGMLRRLASTPISRGEVFVGKWMSRMILGLIQVVVGLTAGTFLFGMDWGPNLPMVVVVLVAWASFCASVGLLAGCLGGTPGQVIGLSILSSMVLAALGGCWWPIEITPDWMQSLQKCLPTGWAMDAMHRLISFRHGAASALPHVVGMLAASVGIGWIGARIFRFQ
jgi:ABC-2 type transport system permease protein